MSYSGFQRYKTMKKFFGDHRERNRPPITSYGVILFTEIVTREKSEIRFFIQQRRDSISYQEFIKGTLSHDGEIQKHIGLMSREERKRCIDYYLKDDPKSLWNDLWVNHKSRIYRTEMERSFQNFKENMSLYIDLFVEEGGVEENSWGFPKGRKHYNENERDCAFREFEEETTIPSDRVQILKIPPYNEDYTGTDGKAYRSVYYIAYIPYIPKIPRKSTPQGIRKSYVSEEVSEIRWASYNECFQKLDRGKTNILRDLYRHLLFSRKRRPPMRRYTR